MTARVNPFEDLGDFKPKTEPKPVQSADIDRLAADNNFPSRQPPRSTASPPARRRFTTGRNQQINIKATAETIDRLYRLADRQHVPLGELLDRALDALESKMDS